MPATALKHLAKKAKVSVDRAEHLWDKAKGIVKSEYDVAEDDPSFWALVTGITKKMMGLKESYTFKEFLAEKAVGDDQRVADAQSVEDAIAMLNAHCKDALWMLDENRPIYRGETGDVVMGKVKKTGFATVDTASTERVSNNTSNYYTLILDNHPDRKQFPKRSRCYIATTNQSRASGYSGWGSKGGTMIIIPFDGTKIGMVNKEDMWDTPVNLFHGHEDIESWNSAFKDMGLSDKVWQTFLNMDTRLKRGDADALKLFKKAFGSDGEGFEKKFIEGIYDAYSAKKTKHTVVTTATMPHKSSSEVWVGGKAMLISIGMWEKLRKALKATKK